ncbi:MAG: GIY-YIG nuclease family protein [Thiobacillus sp.]|nr:GIY-YIG nuclease family protein [Thiobacillus sp.]
MSEASPGAAWVVYILRCADGSLYTGITTDIDRRLAEHNGGAVAPGARYTRSRRPVALAYTEPADSRSAATRREAAIKRLDRSRKLALCALQAISHT